MDDGDGLVPQLCSGAAMSKSCFQLQPQTHTKGTGMHAGQKRAKFRPYQFEYMFLGSGGSHFAEFQKKKKRVWSSVGNNKRCISTWRMRISILSYVIDEN